MSLLIPTANDYRDAHVNIKEHSIKYQQEFGKLKDEQVDGEYIYPFDFEVVNGFFHQSDEKTVDLEFNYATDNLGLVNNWKETIEKLEELNKGEDTYKLIFFARHGQGLHNFAVAKYGDLEWERKWHFLGSDGEIVWGPDPSLTELGIKQAQENNQVLKEQISKGMPMPSKFYCSPMLRSCQTLEESWKGITTPQPIITELIRETAGRSLCHKRSTRKEIVERYPNWKVDENVSEQDTLFSLENGETLYEQCFRVNSFLQQIFSADVTEQDKLDNSFVSTTSHAGTISCVVAVTGHRPFTISTGGMIPMVIRGRKRKNI